MKAKIMFLSMMFLIVIAGTALAASPVGQWDVKFMLHPGLTMGATQGICFNEDGTWYSTTVVGWNGNWHQIGERIRFYGASVNGCSGLFTAAFGQFFANWRMEGEMAHFSSTPGVSTSSLGSWRAVKVAKECDPPAQGNVDPARDPARE